MSLKIHGFNKLKENKEYESERQFLQRSFEIVTRLNYLLSKEKNSKSKLANRLGKKESQISKWLSGSHNFTLRTISIIESALGHSIIIPNDSREFYSLLEGNDYVQRIAAKAKDLTERHYKLVKDYEISVRELQDSRRLCRILNSQNEELKRKLDDLETYGSISNVMMAENSIPFMATGGSIEVGEVRVVSKRQQFNIAKESIVVPVFTSGKKATKAGTIIARGKRQKNRKAF